MGAQDVRRELDAFVSQLWRAGLVADANSNVEKNGRVAWANAGASAALYEAPTIGEYVRLLRERQFTALLSDYAILQLSFEFDGGRLIKARQCFYPCPVIVDPADLEELGIADFIELLAPTELLDRIRLEAPVRFDFDQVAARQSHSASHLTLSRDCCRIPAFGPLSLGHFIRFVFQNFYPDWFTAHAFLKEWPLDWGARTITPEECLGVHVECRRP